MPITAFNALPSVLIDSLHVTVIKRTRLLLWLFFSALKLQFIRIRTSTEYKVKISHLGIFGSLIALSIEGFFSMILSASLVVPIVLIFYLSDLPVEDN